MHRPCLLTSLIILSCLVVYPQESRIVYLSGTGSDHTVDWEFYCTGGQNSGKWTTIPVPSNWELQGFGAYNYGTDKVKADEKGFYRHSFYVPAEWKGKVVEIVFEGSMTETAVRINGKTAGPVHRGAFYRFSYDIGKLLKYGRENILEADVSKMSSDESVNAAERYADYWVFGGIFRPVYLKIMPSEHIERIAADAGADGHFYAEVYTSNLEKADRINITLSPLSGKGRSFTFTAETAPGKPYQVVRGKAANPDLWSPEFPNLYVMHAELLNGEAVIHKTSDRLGFRTIEVKDRDGIFVNGRKIMFRGVCRHSFWPSTGRALNKTISIEDVELMKDMNMNAVRMSHYPPDVHFLDVCDSLGLFVLDELSGWSVPPYDTAIGKKLVREMVTRDVNHPCIVLWDNGNEGGWNNALNDEFAKYDPAHRSVIHPFQLFNGMDTQHYRDWNYGQNVFFNGRDIFFPTEFLHGLYDGGHGAGLDDYWNLMLDRPLSAGGFLWDFSDEGVVRTDKDGWIDTQENKAADGILGPYREKEGSYWSIREIWCPVHFEMENLPPAFDGRLDVENRYIYTRLSQCTFEASLLSLNGFKMEKTDTSWAVPAPDVAPGMRGSLELHLPANWREDDLLRLSVTDPSGRTILNRTWPAADPAAAAEKIIQSAGHRSLTMKETGEQLILQNGQTWYYISRKEGLLDSVVSAGHLIPFGNGPVPAHEEVIPGEVTWSKETDRLIVNATYEKDLFGFRWILHDDGWMELDFRYFMKGSYPYAGVNFSFPEKEIAAVNLVADGPYRVWKNRMKGPQSGMYHKAYNNTVTGESWDYPEFKGYYSGLYRAEFITTGLPFCVVSATEDMFLRLFTPEPPKGAYNDFTSPPFPTGDISFLSAISPIGTKFSPASSTGPKGGMNVFAPNSMPPYREGRLYFYFGERQEELARVIEFFP